MEETDASHKLSTSLDIKLINLVKERPKLFDLRILDRSRDEKVALWEEVSRSLNGELSPKSAKQRWKLFRQGYMKSRIKDKLKKEKIERSGLTLGPRRAKPFSFRYHKNMEFIENTLKHQPGEGQIRYPKNYKSSTKSSGSIKRVIPIAPKPSSTQANNDLPTTSIVTNNVDNVTPITFLHIPSVENDNNQPNINKDSSRTSVTDYDQIFLECLQRPIEQPSPVDGFLIRLGEGLKKLPYRERSKLELEFLERLYEVEEQVESSDSTS